MSFGSTELLIILGILLLLFGSSQLPKLARALGSSIWEIKRGVQGLSEPIEETSDGEKPSVLDEEKTPSSVS